MPRSRKQPDTTLAKRFLYYLDTVFRGNQSMMAQQLGCSQAVISKIKTGRQPPGQRLLSALARHPKINPAWLLTGEGQPLLCGDGRLACRRLARSSPVARHVLRAASTIIGASYRDTMFRSLARCFTPPATFWRLRPGWQSWPKPMSKCDLAISC